MGADTAVGVGLGAASRVAAPTPGASGDRQDVGVAAVLSMVLAALYLATASFGPAQVNDTRAAAVGGWSLGTRGTPALPEAWPPSANYWGVMSRDGRTVVNRFPGVAYWSAPAYALASGAAGAAEPAHPLLVDPRPAAVTAVLTAAAVAGMLFLVLRTVTTRVPALAGTAVAAKGTSLWSVAADAMWPHAPAMLALSGLLLAWRRSHPALTAAGAAVAVTVRPHLVVALAVLAWFAARHERRRDALALTLGGSAGLAAVSAYTLWAFGTPLPVAGYAAAAHVGGLVHHTAWQTTRDLAAALVSPSRGLLTLSPGARRRRGRPDGGLAAPPRVDAREREGRRRLPRGARARAGLPGRRGLLRLPHLARAPAARDAGARPGRRRRDACPSLAAAGHRRARRSFAGDPRLRRSRGRHATRVNRSVGAHRHRGASRAHRSLTVLHFWMRTPRRRPVFGVAMTTFLLVLLIALVVLVAGQLYALMVIVSILGRISRTMRGSGDTALRPKDQ